MSTMVVMFSPLVAACNSKDASADLRECKEEILIQYENMKKEAVELIPKSALIELQEFDDCEYPNGSGWMQADVNRSTPIKSILNPFYLNGWSGPPIDRLDDRGVSCRDCSIEMTKKVANGTIHILVGDPLPEYGESESGRMWSFEISYQGTYSAKPR
ncbi:hypothetical protein OHA77_26820 [Streptosporangium sp. NBC_01639]|uniref:hypothetical protein n=1 Tax=Streptosporangium sp. NBC_01639 TaxID=2975948 RepID=UPI00386D678A|nr:hypothetical protein OHA77_26820 [Streptosporangium sp. NBC_01639]